jgi:hypothetical protein
MREMRTATDFGRQFARKVVAMRIENKKVFLLSHFPHFSSFPSSFTPKICPCDRLSEDGLVCPKTGWLLLLLLRLGERLHSRRRSDRCAVAELD